MILSKFFNSPNERTRKAKKNIAASLFVKAASIIVSLVLVPLTLGYLNEYEYGVWLTLSSVLMWINYFDIGLGNGLRNKLAEALAVNDYDKGRVYVSTSFFLLLLIMIGIYLLFFVAQYWLDWYRILNVDASMVTTNLNSLVTIVFALFCVSFVMKFIGNVYLAIQMPIINDLLVFLGNLLSLVIIYILTRTTNGDLGKVAITFSATPIVVYLIAYPITFFGRYKRLSPRLSSVKFEYSKALMGLGFQFFAIQIVCLIIFSTSNLIISHVCSPQEVTPYNIAFKYYSVVTMAFVIVLAPFWSAATDAYVKKDYAWLKKSMQTILKIWAGLVLLTIVMTLLSTWVYKMWVGKDVVVTFFLSVLTGLYVTVSNWNNLFAYFINGIGKIRLQLYCSILSGILFVPLASGLGNMMGVNGVMLAMTIVLIPSAIALPMQCRKILSGNVDNQIWGK